MTPPKKTTLAALSDKVDSMDRRLLNVEQRQAAEDAYRAALKQVKNEEEEKRYKRNEDQERITRTRVYKEVAKVLGLAALVLGTYVASRGGH